MSGKVFLSGRILSYVLAFACIITLNFFLMRFMPGDPVVHLLGEENYQYLNAQGPQAVEELKAKYGLDKPVHVQYLNYVTRCLKGDFGWSFHYCQPIFNVIIFRLQWTFVLLLPSLILAALLGAFLGALAGWRKGSRLELLITPGFLFLYAVPTYCLGMLFILLFAFYGDMFPLGGMVGESVSGWVRLKDILWHMVLPVAVLVLHTGAYNYLIMRNAVAQVGEEEYILTARAKGLKEKRILFRHVFRNALPPLITVVALEFGFLVSGALLVEIVFSWQGMGTLIYDAVVLRDYPLLQGCFLVLTACVLLANILADVICALIDPRVREGDAAA